MLRRWRDRIVGRVAERHVAGGRLEDGLAVCRWADANGHKTILSPWAGPEDGRRAMLMRFHEAAEAVAGLGPDGVLSVKLDVLGFDRSAFADLWDHCWELGVRLHVDSLAPETADSTFRLLEWSVSRSDRRATPNGSCLGVTIPSRWKRSPADAKRAAMMGLAVRIVKGQWKDPDHAVDPAENYLRIASADFGTVPVGVATHDLRVARGALGLIKRGDARAELEQFFSLPHNGRSLAKTAQVPYRLYVAFGSPALPYNIRFSSTRPAMALWMARDYSFSPRRPWETWGGSGARDSSHSGPSSP
jgi:hypothetical protein